jgi:hypothetical protein
MDNIVFKGSISNCFSTSHSFYCSSQIYINISLEDGKDTIFNHSSIHTNKKVIMKSIHLDSLDKVITNLKEKKELRIQFGFTRLSDDLLHHDMVITFLQNNNMYILKIKDTHNTNMFKFPINDTNTTNLLLFFEGLNSME